MNTLNTTAWRKYISNTRLPRWAFLMSVTVMVTAILSSCGQKGSLVLPQPKTAPTATVPTETPHEPETLPPPNL